MPEELRSLEWIIDKSVYDFEVENSSMVHRQQFWRGFTQNSGGVSERIIRDLQKAGYTIVPQQVDDQE